MSRFIDVIGAPFDFGGGGSGAGEGPRALVLSGILGALERKHIVAHSDLLEISQGLSLFPISPLLPVKKTHTAYVKEVSAVISSLAARTFASLRLGHTPLILGGDHSVVIGSIGAALQPDLLGKKRLGLIWIDAHYDAHTERTTLSGNANGMPLASLLGRGLRAFRAPLGNRKIHPQNVLHIGAGSADCEPEEVALLKRLGVRCFTEENIFANGVTAVQDAYDELCKRVDCIWVSFDIDAVNKYWAPGVAYPNKGGLEYRTLFVLVDHFAKNGKIIGADIVEYVPRLEEYDPYGVPKTASLATEFALRLLK